MEYLGIAIIVLLAATGVGALYYSAYIVNSQWFGKTSWRGENSGNSVALTFDDGPGEDTDSLLDVLAELQIRATFFLVGENVERFPEVARRIADDGHEIGNHSYSHRNFLFCGPSATEQEMRRAQEVIAAETGHLPLLARPPYGVRTPAYFRVARSLGLTTVQWTTAGFDWKSHSPRRIAELVLRDVRPGSIILLHDADSSGTKDQRKTVESIPLLEKGLRAKGLRILPLDQLLKSQLVS